MWTLVRALIFAALTATLSYPASAASLVKVTLSGEEGGMMSIAIDQATILPGAVVFEVTNQAVGTVHEMVVVRLANKSQVLSVDPANHRLNEKALKVVGEASDLKPLKTRKLPLSLSAGEYVLICNIKGHFEAGMTAPLTVRKN